MNSTESQLAHELIAKLSGLKYEHHVDITNRTSLEKGFRYNTIAVVSQFRINTPNSRHHCVVVLHINGVPVTRIELKTLGINPRLMMEQSSSTSSTPTTAMPVLRRSPNDQRSSTQTNSSS